MKKIIITEEQFRYIVKESNQNNKFLELVKKYMYEPESRYPFNVYTLSQYVKNWPNITYNKDGIDEEITEELDMENSEILSLTKDKLVFSACGDWQPEYTVVVKLVNGKLSATSCKPYNRKVDGKNKPTKNQMLKLLGLEDDYKEKQKKLKQKKEEDKIIKYIEEYKKWSTYGKPSEASVLEFLQNNHETDSEDEKLKAELLKRIPKDTLIENKSILPIDKLKEKYPNSKITLQKQDAGIFKNKFFVKVEIKKQDGEYEQIAAIKGYVPYEQAIQFVNNTLNKNYDKFY